MLSKFLLILSILLLFFSMFSCGDDDDDNSDDGGTEDDDDSVDDDDSDDDDDSIDDDDEPEFPVEPEILVDGEFERCEGIAFNGQSDLYVTGDKKLWRVDTEGNVTYVADMDSNLGLAAIGSENLLVADFGPTNGFDHGPNDDGVVWRISPDGTKEEAATGIGDPNFIVVREDLSFLVSDDAVNEIWLVETDGTTSLYTDAIDHPNGLAYSLDGQYLYVAQIFQGIDPIVWDNRIWQIRIENGEPTEDIEVLSNAGEGHDGLAMDSLGRVYTASNNSGEIIRIDPESGEEVVIAENLHGVASLAFGQGDFDHESIYATNHRNGRVYVVSVGVTGAELYH
jgi:sugar lactone lactonase YvrE